MSLDSLNLVLANRSIIRTNYLEFSVDHDANVTLIRESLQKLDNTLSIALLKESLESLREMPFIAQLKIVAQVFSFILVVSILLILGYFTFSSMSDRKNEIAIYRALGMTSSQILKLIMIEMIYILYNSHNWLNSHFLLIILYH